MADERDELLAHVATQYYLLDKSQQDIADQLDISRSNISRMLKEARERGIVEIVIRHPLRRVVALEHRLVDQFGLQDAGVVLADPANPERTLNRAAELAARLLEQSLDDRQILGISWGTAVHATANAFAPRRHYDVEVVQLMGGIGPTDPMIDGPALAQRFAQRLSNRYRYLHGPLVVDAPEIAQALLAQRNNAETLEVARRSHVALVGIGALDPDVSSLLRAGYLSRAEFDAIRERGIVGDICARHFDQFGRPAAPELDRRLISITLDDLAAIPRVIGVACGEAKAVAILAALRGNHLDALVTDSLTAEAILRLVTP
jgi:deoxyribonucleoside regulator